MKRRPGITCCDSHLADTTIIRINDIHVTLMGQIHKYRKEYTLRIGIPDESTATPNGLYNFADVAAPPSPL